METRFLLIVCSNKNLASLGKVSDPWITFSRAVRSFNIVRKVCPNVEP